MVAPSQVIKNAFFRITLTRFTVAFFLFSFIHCFAEGFIQAFIFTQDSEANSVVLSILRQAEVPRNDFGVLTRNGAHATLDLCNRIPSHSHPYSSVCERIFETGHPNMTMTADTILTTSLQAGAFTSIDLAEPTKQPNGDILVPLQNGQTVAMNQTCTLLLTYPHQVLMNSLREDIVLVLSQFWIFFVSFFAILYDSIPHLVAALCFRVLSTGWSMYIIWRTGDVEARFDVLLNPEDSPCSVGVDSLFPGYFDSRKALQIPDLILNVLSLAMAAYLSVQLVKIYGPNTFNRVGAPARIIRIYNYFLAMFVSFQVAAFLLISVVCLWLDQMINSDNAISGMTIHRPLYIALSIFTLAILIPWIVMGWYSVRREWKRLMIAFLGLATIVLTCWILMLMSWSFAWTFVQWPFFACNIIAASISLMTTIGFGVVSYVHFGKGLAHYLYVDGVLAETGFEPDHFERDLEKAAGPDDWREIVLDEGLNSLPKHTISFTTEQRSQYEKDPK